MKAPIYTQWFVLAEKGEEGAFPVIGKDWEEGNDWDAWLKPVKNLSECVKMITGFNRDHPEGLTRETMRLVFVRVEHEAEYPYARWDYEDTRERLIGHVMGREPRPTRYCEAALVATPKMALI